MASDYSEGYDEGHENGKESLEPLVRELVEALGAVEWGWSYGEACPWCHRIDGQHTHYEKCGLRSALDHAKELGFE